MDTYRCFKIFERRQRVENYFHSCPPVDRADLKTVELDFSDIGSEKLWAYLSSTLNFPKYFGNNWNAFIDVLPDLEFVKSGSLALVHSSFPGQLDPKTAAEYLTCLLLVTERIDGIYWRRFADLEQGLIKIYRIDFYFPREQHRAIVENLVGQVST